MTEFEIEIIKRKAYALDEVAEIFDCDIFIDVPLKDSTASIVVYHVFPTTKASLYKQSPVAQPALKMNEPGVWAVTRSGNKLTGYKAFTQEKVFVRQDIYPIKNKDKTIGVFITERPFSEIQQQENEEQDDYMIMTARLNNYIDDVIYFFDITGKLIFQNDKADSFSDNLSGENVHYNQLFGDQISYSELILKDDEEFSTEIKLGEKYFLLKRILLEDDKLKFAIILRDITPLKDKEAEIISKTDAIRETHHRIKNNLQTIASLLRMEKRRINSPETEQLLTDNMNRIMSIAATHDILARQLGDEVELSDVLKFIISNIYRSYSLMDHIKLTIDAEESIVVLSEVATSVSLIVNELVQNCYNHAFPNHEKGEISISLKREKDEVVISVKDNGIGFEIDKLKSKSLGLVIVKTYVVDKLKGTIQFNKRREGMDITFRF
ncbi:histidine kinase N-terminal domain-containing protein [Ralstonia pickettii]|nr:histidine kinase N-terminal domain-containing protein [Ralstonia pickettii]